MNRSIATLKNVGPKRIKAFKSIGISTLDDLVSYYPRDYEDRSKTIPISEIEADEVNIIKARIKGLPQVLKFNSTIITKVTVSDNTGTVTLIWFNQPYLKNNFKRGDEYIFIGKGVFRYNELNIISPDYEKITEKELLSSLRIVPKYRLPQGISIKMFRSIVYDALSQELTIEENLPDWVLNEYKLCAKNIAVTQIHFPDSDEMFLKARKRLVFEELFLTQIMLFEARGFIKSKNLGIKFSNMDYSQLNLPFQLTQQQQKVANEICEDLSSGATMNRLLQGDVGSGKTAVAMIACHICINNGYQSAVMVPTEVLAKQHFISFGKLFSGVVLLLGSMKKKERMEALEEIKSGRAKMIIGTHALIQEAVEFHNLGLTVTDEQHRFGVRQRAALSAKGENPHILIMSATPIPRTLALILYGDLDISTIDQLPPGRKPIDTFAVTTKYRERIYTFIKKELDKGRQAYIVCPSIEEGEDSTIAAVEEYACMLNEIFAGYNPEALHGKMRAAEKDEIMNRFLSGETKVLISTTVIEVGVNVPTASVMVIENAERFGLSQLHQLRGRVGRGSDKAYCILISDSRSKITRERLSAMVKTQDGFELSRLDLELRGPGDFFGVKQHGLPEMKIANLYKDIDILKLAQEAASNIEETGIGSRSDQSACKADTRLSRQITL